ncbi:unnamed protein product, partial [Rotaria magnacalcarata]
HYHLLNIIDSHSFNLQMKNTNIEGKVFLFNLFKFMGICPAVLYSVQPGYLSLLIDVAIRLGLRLGLCVGIDIALDLLIDVFIADIGTVINLNIRNIDIISDIRVLFRFGIGINIIHTGICFRLGIGFVDIGTAFNDILLGIVINNRKSIDTGRAIGFGFVYCRYWFSSPCCSWCAS